MCDRDGKPQREKNPIMGKSDGRIMTFIWFIPKLQALIVVVITNKKIH